MTIFVVSFNCLISFKVVNQSKSNQTTNSLTCFLQLLVYTRKNKMAKYLQWKIMCRDTICKEILYKPRPHNAKIKNKLKHIKNKYTYICIYLLYIYN